MPAVNDVGEPCAREPHARFDGRELETECVAKATEVGQPDGKPRASRLRDLPPNNRHRASSRPYTVLGHGQRFDLPWPGRANVRALQSTWSRKGRRTGNIISMGWPGAGRSARCC